jgi:hypothetical protein
VDALHATTEIAGKQVTFGILEGMISAVISQDGGVRHAVAPLGHRTPRLRLAVALTPQP